MMLWGSCNRAAGARGTEAVAAVAVASILAKAAAKGSACSHFLSASVWALATASASLISSVSFWTSCTSWCRGGMAAPPVCAELLPIIRRKWAMLTTRDSSGQHSRSPSILSFSVASGPSSERFCESRGSCFSFLATHVSSPARAVTISCRSRSSPIFGKPTWLRSSSTTCVRGGPATITPPLSVSSKTAASSQYRSRLICTTSMVHPRSRFTMCQLHSSCQL
mmetsp:Transcript_38573/g.92162  ORF Transcript_38573/g.92162 Transcript_38573/m.92162 type:complete len:223 (+) Transcript_38573:732-1400(+)